MHAAVSTKIVSPAQRTAARWLFSISALLNFQVVIALAWPYSPAWKLLGRAPPQELGLLHLFLAFVALFGAAYAWIAVRPQGKAPLIVLSAVGKCAAFSVVLAHVFAGNEPVQMAAAMALDLVFAALFIGYLRRWC